MAEDDAPGGEPAGGQGGNGATADDPTTVAELAAAFDDQIAASLGGTAKGDGEGKGAGSAVADPAVVEFINKNYGGDAQAFLHAQYQSRTENQRLAARLAELENTQRGGGGAGPSATPADPEAAFKAARAASARVQSIDRDMQSVTEDLKALGTRQADIMAAIGKKEGERNQLQGQMMKAEADEKANINLQILSIQSSIDSLMVEYNNNDSTIRTNNRDRARLKRELDSAEEELRAAIDEQDAVEKKRASVQALTRTTFNNTMIEQAKVYGVEIVRNPDGRLDFKDQAARTLYHSVRTQAIEYLDAMDDDAINKDAIVKLVLDLLKNHEDAGWIKKKAPAPDPKKRGPGNAPGRTGAAHTPVAPRVVVPAAAAPPNGDGNAPRTLDDIKKDPNFWRQRADHIFTGGRGNGRPF